MYEIVGSNFPAVKLRLIPINPLKIGSFFQYKDRLNYLMTSNVVYKYSCPKCDFGTYIGSTKRVLKVRVDSHKGVSHRTGNKLTNPEFSNIRDHTKNAKAKFAPQTSALLVKFPTTMIFLFWSL